MVSIAQSSKIRFNLCPSFLHSLSDGVYKNKTVVYEVGTNLPVSFHKNMEAVQKSGVNDSRGR